MGWWAAGNGVWGDEPADILDEALERILAVYRRDHDREPYQSELFAGLKFCLPDSIAQE